MRYGRISADDQNPGGQVGALGHAGITEIIQEQASGVGERPPLESLVASLATGDTLAVTEVSRLGRSMSEALLLAAIRDYPIDLQRQSGGFGHPPLLGGPPTFSLLRFHLGHGKPSLSKS